MLSLEIFLAMTFFVAEFGVLVYSLYYYACAILGFFPRSEKSEATSTKLPFFSILIPVYNEKEIVRRSIEACLMLDYPREMYEILVVDDSDDEVTPSIVKEYPIVHIRRDRRYGFRAGALNTGVRKARGEIIVVFDSDMCPEGEYLRKLTRHFEDGKVAVVQTRLELQVNSLLDHFAAALNDALYHSYLKYQTVVGTVTFTGFGAVRKSSIESVGGFTETAIGEDIDLSQKMLAGGHRAVYAEDIVSYGLAPSSWIGLVRQQTRWAYGTTQALMKNGREIVASEALDAIQKTDLLLASSAYMIFPSILAILSVGVANLYYTFFEWQHPTLWLILTLAGLGYFFQIFVGLMRAHRMADIRLIPLFTVITNILMFPIFVSVIKALINMDIEFYVTPKG